MTMKIIRSQRRTVSLEITDEGELLVRAPEKMSRAELETVLERHRRWITRKMALVQQRINVVSRNYQPGEKFLYLGQKYPLRLKEGQGIRAGFDGQTFWLTEKARFGARMLFEKLYRKMAREYLSKRLDLLSRKHGLGYKKFRLSSARRRWGSCSARGTISLNWRLIMAPPEIVDYVILHELAHLKVRSHSPAFWSLLSRYIPDYQIKRKWLKENGFRLNLI
ncbi:MAG: M48 family metallopeptidase [Candidatus Saccharicenans sp.]